MPRTDVRVDVYIAKSADFAQPILNHIRKLIHAVCPAVEETIKWGCPTFEYKGSLLGSMVSFKKHCSFRFWKATGMEDPDGILSIVGKTSMGSLGQLTVIEDLPSDKIFRQYIKEAMRLNEENVTITTPKAAVKKTASATPGYLQDALKKNKKAASVFEQFSPSARKEYIEWLEDAKTEATREKRLATALEWMAEGKQRHWKYQK